MSTYAVIRFIDNICDNIIVWDGVTPWSPGDEHYVENIDGVEAGIGWAYHPESKEWTPPKHEE